VLASVVGAYYYLRMVKVMFFDAPTDVPVVGGTRMIGALTAAAAVFCSPLGYLLLGPLTAASRLAAKSLF